MRTLDVTPAERKAAEVLGEVPAWVWDGRRLPVPVEDIVDSHFGLRICEVEDLGRIAGAPADVTLSGLLVVDDRKVFVNAAEAKDSPGRRRFTIGHEAGHWCLHREEHGKVFCRATAAAVGLDALPEDAPDIEEEASQFAGALLFPRDLVRREWERFGDLEELQQRFAGSRVATERAFFRAVHRDEVLERGGDALECFSWDDEGYDAWRAAHRQDGFVVNDCLGDPAGARLHVASCHHLNKQAKPGRPRTRTPKWCSLDAPALRAVFPQAKRCSGCEKWLSRHL